MVNYMYKGYYLIRMRDLILVHILIFCCCKILLISGETPLTHAARQGHTATAKYLVDQGAHPSIPSGLGATPLHYSAGEGTVLSFS